MLSISQLFLSTVKWSNDPYSNGALIIYVNRWCRPVFLLYFVKVVLCCQDLELLAVSLQPYYLKREFSQVIAICVFIPPRADAATACETIHSSMGRLQTQYPEAVFSIILAAFNHVILDSNLAAFHKFVDCRDARLAVYIYSGPFSLSLSLPPPVSLSFYHPSTEKDGRS